MHPVISDADWSRLSRFVAEATGLHFPRPRWSDLQRGVAGAMADLGFADEEQCVAWLLSGPPAESRFQLLAQHLTVGETYFFRDRPVMDAVASRVLAPLVDARRGRDQRLRIWSAGCCTGEEPYSLAILLHQMLPDLRNWDVAITATDINARFLRRAAAAVYGEWSFRDTPPGFRESYFTPTADGRYALLPEIRRMVRFSRLNLAAAAYPSAAGGIEAVDLIFCRNVLMYFKPAAIDSVVARFRATLSDGGWLVVSPSEASAELCRRFVMHSFPGAILYQRNDAEDRACSADRCAEPQPAVHLAPDPPPMLAPTPAADRPHPPASILPASAAADAAPLPPAPTAETLFREGRYGEAVEALLDATPNEPAALSMLTRALANLGRLDEALCWCERWIAADRMGVGPRYLQAVILTECRDVEGARAALRRAIYLQPDFVMAHFALGNLARDGGRVDDARRHFSNALGALRGCDPDVPVPESDGVPARRLAETIVAMTAGEARRAG